MSREIDEKIVSMELDNSNFEENARESMSTLDKLKEKLNFKNTDDGLDNVAKSAEKANPAFSKMGEAVESVKLKLSALEVVGITALQNITNKAIDAGLSLAKSLSIDQISAGWAKYGEKTQAVQTIMAATGDSIEHTEEIMDKLNWYSDETSYSFTKMATTVGKFVNQNGDLDKSATAVMGLANALGLAGVSAKDADRAFIQMAQAIGRPLMAQDWSSLETLAADSQKLKQTYIEEAAALGTLVKVGEKYYTLDKKTEVSTSNFRDTLAKHWATADVQMAVYSKFGEYSDAIWEMSDAYDTCAEAMAAFDATGKNVNMEMSELAFKNNQVAKTAVEAIDATKDAVSSQFMTAFQTLFGNVNEASVLWTDVSMKLWDTFASPLDKVNDVLKEAFGSPVNEFKEKLNEVGVTTEQFEKALKQAGKDAGVDVDALIKKYGSLEDVIKSGELNVLTGAEGNTNLLTSALRNLADTATTSKSVTAEATKSLEDYKKVVHDVVQGEYGTGEARVKALTKAGWDYNTVQNAVNVAWDGSKLHLERLNKEMFKLSDAELKSKGYTDEQIKALRELAEQAETAGSDIDKLIQSLTRPSGRELLAKSITNIIDAVNSWKDVVIGAFSEVFGEGLSEKIYKVVEAFEKFTSKLILSEEASEKLQNALSFVLKAGQTVTKTILSPLKTIGTIISTIASKLFETIKEVDGSKIFSNLTEWLKNVKEQLSDFAEKSDKVREKIQEWAKSVGKFKSFEDFRNGIKNLISQFPKLEEVINKVKGAFDKLKGVWDSIWNSKAIKTLRDTLSSAFDTVAGNLSTFFSGAGETISGIFEKVVSYISGLLKGDISFGDVIREIKDLGPNVENVKSFFADWGEKLKTVKSNATDAFKTIFDWIEKVASKIKDNFDELGLGNLLGVLTGISTFLAGKSLFKIGGAVEEAGGKVGEGFGKAAGVLSELRDTLKSYQRELNASAFKEIAEALALMAGAMWLIAQIPEDRFSKAAGTLGVMLTALVGINTLLGYANKKLPLGATGLSAKLDSSGLSASGSMSMMANMWLLSKAILTMIKAFKMLTDAGIQNISWKKIGKILGVMAACITELGLVAIALGHLSTLTVPGSIATLIEALGIYAMMKLFKEIADFDPNIVLDNLGSFITIFSLIGIMFAETRLASPNALPQAAALIVLDAAVWLMGEVIEKLAKIPWDTFKEGAKRTLIIEGLLGFWEIINTLVSVIRKLGKISGSTGTTSFLGLAAAIYSMASAIDLLGRMDADKLKQGTKAVAAIMALLSMVLTASHEAKGAWSSILALTAFLSVFTIAMSVLTTLKDSQIRKMKTITNQMAKVFLALSVAMAAAGLMGKWKVDKGPILSMMGLFAEVAVALGLLTVFVKDGDKFKAIATGITEVLLALGGAFALIGVGNKFGSTEHMGKIVAMISILTVIAGAIGSLISWLSTWKNVNLDQMKMLTEAIAILTPIVSGMGILMALVGSVVGSMAWSDIGKILVMITGLSAIAAGLGFAVSAFTKIASDNPWAAIPIVTGVGILLTTISGVLLLLSITPELSHPVSTLASFAALAALAAAIGYFLSEWSGKIEDPWSVIALATGISELLVVITGVCLAASVLGTVAGPALAGIGVVAVGMVGLIGSLVGIAEGVGALMQIQGFEENLENFKRAMSLIGQAFGELVGGALEGFSNHMPDVATNMSEFIENVKPFFDGLKNIPEDSKEQITRLKEVLMALTGAEIKDAFAQGIAKLFGVDTDFSTFGSQLEAFSCSLKRISNNLKDASIESIEKIATIFSTLCNIDVNTGNGIFSLFTGKDDVKTYGKQLEDFADSLVKFANKTSEIKDTSHLSKISLIVKTLTEASSSMNTGNGLGGLFTGKDDIKTFGKQLEHFGKSLSDFQKKVKDVDASDGGPIDNAIKALDKLATVSSKLPKSGGFLSMFKADSDMSTFGKELEGLADGIKKFANASKDIKSATDADNAIAVLNKIINIQWPESGGLIGKIMGADSDMGAFGTNLEDLAKGIAKFAKESKDVKSDQVTDALTALKNIASTMVLLNTQLEGYSSENIDKITAFLSTDFSGLSAFGGNLASTITNSVNSHLTDLQNIGISVMTAIASGITQNTALVTAAIQNVVVVISSALTSGVPQITSIGMSLGEAILLGISTGLSSSTIATDFIFTLTAALTSAEPTLVNSGMLLANAVATGMTNSLAVLTAAGVQLAAAVQRGGASRYNDMVQLGGRFVLGICNGIHNAQSSASVALSTAISAALSGKATTAYDGGYSIGSNLIQGMKSALSDGSGSLSTYVSSVVQSALAAAKKAAGIKSPSKRMYEIGEYMVEGLILGLDSMNDKLDSTSSSLAKSTLTGFTNTFSEYNGLLGSFQNVQPRISPIVDLNNANRGLDNFGFAARNYAATVGANVTSTMQSRVAVAVENAAAVKNLSRKLDAIAADNTANRYLKIIAENSDKDLYLDGDTLVGGLTPRMDKSLGIRANQIVRHMY